MNNREGYSYVPHRTIFLLVATLICGSFLVSYRITHVTTHHRSHQRHSGPGTGGGLYSSPSTRSRGTEGSLVGGGPKSTECNNCTSTLLLIEHLSLSTRASLRGIYYHSSQTPCSESSHASQASRQGCFPRHTPTHLPPLPSFALFVFHNPIELVQAHLQLWLPLLLDRYLLLTSFPLSFFPSKQSSIINCTIMGKTRQVMCSSPSRHELD